MMYDIFSKRILLSLSTVANRSSSIFKSQSKNIMHKKTNIWTYTPNENIFREKKFRELLFSRKIVFYTIYILYNIQFFLPA